MNNNLPDAGAAAPEPERSEYFHKISLDNVKQRYLLKMEFINNIDPYCLTRDSPFLINSSELPEVSEIDIYAYFVSSHSTYSFEEFKAYKSLNAQKYIEAGFVEKPLIFKMNDNYFLIIAKVGTTAIVKIVCMIKRKGSSSK